MNKALLLLSLIVFPVFVFCQGLTYEPLPPRVKPSTPDSLLKEGKHHLAMGAALTSTGPLALSSGIFMIIVGHDREKKFQAVMLSLGSALIIAGALSTIAGSMAIHNGRKEIKLGKLRLLPAAYLDIPSPLIACIPNGGICLGLSTTLRF